MKIVLKLIAGLIGIVFVGILAVAIALATLGQDTYKNWISGKLREATGRELQVNGDLEVDIFPWLGVTAADVTFSNRPGFSAAPFLRADSLAVRLKLLPLLWRRYEVDTIRIQGAEVNLEVDAAGERNWSDLFGHAAGSGVNMPLAAFMIGGVNISGARFTYDDRMHDRRYAILDLNLESGELVSGKPVDLTMRFTAAADRPDVSAETELKGVVSYITGDNAIQIRPVTIASLVRSAVLPEGQSRMTFTGNIDIDTESQSVTFNDLDLDALGARLNGTVTVADLAARLPGVTADVNVTGADIALPFKVMEVEPLATQLARQRDRSYHMVLKLDADLVQGEIALPDFTLTMLGANIKGEITSDNAGADKGALRGTIEAAGPDLPTLMQVAGLVMGGGDSPLAVYGKDLNSLTADKKAFATILRFVADTKSGDIDLPALSLSGLGMNITGVLKATNMKSNSGAIKGNFTVIGQELPPVLRAIGRKDLAGSLQSFILDLGIDGGRRNVVLEPFSLKALFAGDQIPGSPVNLALNAKTTLDLEQQNLAIEGLRIRGLGLDVNGQLSATRFIKDPNYQGELHVEEFNLRELLRQMNLKVPDTGDTATLRKVALNSSFQGTRNDLEVNSLGLVLDDTRLEGRLSMHDFGNPAYRFNLDIDAIDLDRYLPVKKAKTGKGGPQAATTTPLPVETLKNLNADGELRIGQMILSKAKLADLRLKLTAGNGEIKLNPSTASLYQGGFTGDLALDVKGKLPRMTLNAALSGVQVEPLMADVKGKARVRGLGDFNAALSAAGADTFAMKQTLNGKMSFSFKDGAIKGYNLGKILRMASQLQSNFSLKVSDQEETDFTEITGNPVAENGVIRLDDLAGKSPAVRLGGRGVIADLPNQAMDYTITARLVATSTGQGGRELQQGKLEGVPLECRMHGPMDEPKRDCDAAKLIAALGLKAIERVITLPTKVLPLLGGQQQPEDGTAGQQDAGGEASQQEAPTNDPVKKMRDALKGLGL
ncbi:MAG TPA: AsmA family protein [Gammaproteobacteria bacterium]|nr:AsmA family protein [Gammaproteobacteria bacterium]